MSGCNCNDNYENIKRKLDEKNSKIKYCYIQGPKGEQGEPGKTGARGPQGPASISVGLTETVMPDSNASVEIWRKERSDRVQRRRRNPE